MPVWEALQRPIAFVALVLLSPVLVVLWLAVVLTSGRPFLYGQTRPGLHGRPFRAWKIRTMRNGADRDVTRQLGVTLADPMVTPIGRILRDTKLDELPQLWNVLRGEMQLVGPRPIGFALQTRLEREIPGFSRRLAVKPGLTNLGQVCVVENDAGTGLVADWSRRFEAEMHHARHRSATYDLAMVAMTVVFALRKVARAVGRRLARRTHEPTRSGRRLAPGRGAGPVGNSMRVATRRPLLGVVPEHAVVAADARPGAIREPRRGPDVRPAPDGPRLSCIRRARPPNSRADEVGAASCARA
ncbi:MAG: sugar transferase [Planctomycetes bacterium]|nr:sugar transferase [Planctomycetota bacterium]